MANKNKKEEVRNQGWKLTMWTALRIGQQLWTIFLLLRPPLHFHLVLDQPLLHLLLQSKFKINSRRAKLNPKWLEKIDIKIEILGLPCSCFRGGAWRRIRGFPQKSCRPWFWRKPTSEKPLPLLQTESESEKETGEEEESQSFYEGQVVIEIGARSIY